MSNAVRTPWSDWVTQGPQGFRAAEYAPQGLTIEAQFGGMSVRSSIELPSRRITQTGPGGEGTVEIAPYTLPLRTWVAPGGTILEVHPFVLVHLAATRQVNLRELSPYLERLQPAVRATLAVTWPCDLLTRTGRSRINLRLGTDFDLARAFV